MSTITGIASLSASAAVASRSIVPLPAAGYVDAVEAANGGVLHYWPMYDVLDDQAIIDRVGSLDGVVHNDSAGASLVTNGLLGRARDFVAAGYVPNDTINLRFDGDGSTTTDLANWTMVVWFYMHGGPNYSNSPCIFYVRDTASTDGAGFRVLLEDTDSLVFESLVTAIPNITTTAPSVGAWHQLLIQNSDVDGVELFLDNVSFGSDSDQQLLNPYQYDWFVGDYSETAGSVRFFDGMVDEMVIFDRVLTSAERGNLYNSGAGIQLYKNANYPTEDIAEVLGWSEATTDSVALERLVAEVLGFGETAPTVQMNSTADLDETFGLSEDTTAVRLVLVTVAEGLGFNETVTDNATLIELLSEGVGFGVGVELAGELYVGWCMNTETGAVSAYEGYNFNSMTKFQGDYLGLSEGGLFELDGAKDGSTNIDAYIRLDRLDFGTERMKRMPKMWLGYSADGAMALKTIDSSGIERWYDLAETNGNLRERMVKMARRPESLYWSLEVRNKKGADFKIDRMNLLPVILTRRTNRRK